MRILFMADVPPDPNSGAAGTEYQSVLALRALGHDVDALWAADIGRCIRHGNLHYLIELPRAYRRALKKAFERRTYDVVRVNQPHGYLAARWLRRRHPESVFIHRSHGLEPKVEHDLKPWRTKFEADTRSWPRRAVSQVLGALLAHHWDRIAHDAFAHEVYATADRDFLVSELHVPRERIGVIPAGVTPSLLATDAPPMTPERLRTVLYVGQFAFVKAPMIVAGAMNAFARAHTGVRLVWICAAAHHPEVRALLEPEARERIELLGWMRQEDLVAQFDRAGIFLFPSFFEGFGKAFLEAMSRGLVVIASDMGGPHDVIENGFTGFLTPVGDVAAIVERAEWLLKRPEAAAEISRAAAAEARKYTWERAALETEAFYASLPGMRR